MKLGHETLVRTYPILTGQSLGGNRMPKLRLHVPELEERDTIPFPVERTTDTPRRAWTPRLSGQPHDAEEAVEVVQHHLNRLKSLLDSDDDRPRAA